MARFGAEPEKSTPAASGIMKLPIILFVVAHLQCYAAVLIELVWPGVATRTFDHFINYSWPWPEQPMYLNWWIKYNTDTIMMILIFAACMCVFARYSLRLWLCSLMLLCYHCIDLFLLWYDYRTSHITYYALGATMIACVASMFAKDKKIMENGRIISIE